ADKSRRLRALVCGAPPRPSIDKRQRVSVLRGPNEFAPLGAPLPRLFRGCEKDSSKTRARKRRGNKIVCGNKIASILFDRRSYAWGKAGEGFNIVILRPRAGARIKSVSYAMRSD